LKGLSIKEASISIWPMQPGKPLRSPNWAGRSWLGRL
jgi:hypothetical protein